MFEPTFVMTNVPCASGVQFALSENFGGTGVGVAVGDRQNVDAVAGAAPPPDVSSSRVPNRPLVLIFVLAPAFSWKLFVAIGVPLRSSV